MLDATTDLPLPCSCDGVIWEGDHVIEGVHTTLKHLRQLGKRIFFVTNNATKSREQNLAKFRKLGIEANMEEIFTSAFASASYLKNILKFPEDKKVYVVGEKGIEDELDAVGIRHSGGTVSRCYSWYKVRSSSYDCFTGSRGQRLCRLDGLLFRPSRS